MTTPVGEVRGAEEAYWAHNLTGHVFGSCWVCQRMRTHNDHVITVGLVRSIISTLDIAVDWTIYRVRVCLCVCVCVRPRSLVCTDHRARKGCV